MVVNEHTTSYVIFLTCLNEIFFYFFSHTQTLNSSIHISVQAGIKMINIETNKVVRVVGKVESGERFLRLHLFQGTPVVDKQYLLSKG